MDLYLTHPFDLHVIFLRRSTHSLNGFAGRSPAFIVRVDQETAELKIAAYDAIWRNATPI
jgi:hypothetical protein